VVFARCCTAAEIDFHDNELKMSRYVTDRLAEIAEKMGPRQISAGEVEEGLASSISAAVYLQVFAGGHALRH
jgi:hypothetical protein